MLYNIGIITIINRLFQNLNISTHWPLTLKQFREILFVFVCCSESYVPNINEDTTLYCDR